jgi:hypothetical protein
LLRTGFGLLVTAAAEGPNAKQLQTQQESQKQVMEPWNFLHTARNSFLVIVVSQLRNPG